MKFNNSIKVFKIFVSIAAGLLCLFLSKYSKAYPIGEINITIPISLIFPILISTAYGYKYGFIAALFGGALYPFLIWPADGWANVLNFTNLTVLIVIVGYCSNLPKVLKNRILTILFIAILYLLFLFLLYFYAFNYVIQFKPPFWVDKPVSFYPQKVLLSFFSKDIINYSLIIIFGEMLVKLPFVRTVLRLKNEKWMRKNNRIFLFSISIALGIWFIFYYLDFLLNAHSYPVELHKYYLPLSFTILFLSAGLIGRVLIAYLESNLKAVDLLKESKDAMQALLNATFESAFLCDVNGEILNANEIAAKRFNKSIDDIVGQNVFDILPENLKQSRKANYEEVVKTKKSVRFQDIRNDRLYDTSIYPIFNDNHEIGSFAIYAKDITEQRKAENSLIESEKKYRAQYNYAPFPVYTIKKINGELIFTDTNNATKNYPFIHENKIINRKITDFFFDESDKELVRKIEETMEKQEVNTLDIFYEFKTTGKKRHMNMIMGYIPTDTVLLFMNDVTDKKNAQEKLLHAMMKAEERERSRIAKELHDGVSPILSAVKLYFQTFMNASNEQIKENISEKIITTVDEAITTVSDISNKLSPHVLRNFGLSAAIQTVIEKASDVSGLHFSFFYDVQEQLPENIETNLYRVCVELVNNTLKYGDAKSVIINIIQDQKIIKLHFEHNGKGFDFEQVRKNNKGMGLHNILNRIKSINGIIDLDTNNANGVKVIIEIPLVNE